MCVMATVDGVEVGIVGTLAEQIGCEPVPVGGEVLDRTECLCSVDFEATAEKAGFDAVRDWDNLGDWVLTKRTNPSAIGRDHFDAHLRRASATVAQWPEWKRNLLGG